MPDISKAARDVQLDKDTLNQVPAHAARNSMLWLHRHSADMQPLSRQLQSICSGTAAMAWAARSYARLACQGHRR